MVRRRTRTRRRFRRKRNYRRRATRARIPRIGRLTGMNGTHMVRQKVFEQGIIPASGVTPLPYYINKTYNFSQINQAVSFRNLYDRYCIYGASIQIIFNDNQPPTGNQSMTLAWSQDHDGAATPASWNIFLERANVRTKTMTCGGNINTQWSTYTKPKPLGMLYESPAGTGYQILPRNKPVWIDMSDPAVPHYGTLIGLNNGMETLNVAIHYTIITTYYLGFRGLQ